MNLPKKAGLPDFAQWLTVLLSFAALALSSFAYGQSGRDTLGEGDSVKITVFQNPDLTTEARLSEKGTIAFPLIGEVSLAGLTPAAAGNRIAKALVDGKFMLKPQVTVNMTESRSRQVSVLGEVTKPGRYVLDANSSYLTDVLAQAGGITALGDDTVTVMLKRNGKVMKMGVDVSGMYKRGDLSKDVLLENGDTVYVQRAPVFYVYGEVQKAGSYKLEPSMTVMHALSVGGGLTVRGSERGMKIRRRAQDGSFQNLDAKLTDVLQPDDVLFVRESLF